MTQLRRTSFVNRGRKQETPRAEQRLLLLSRDAPPWDLGLCRSDREKGGCARVLSSAPARRALVVAREISAKVWAIYPTSRPRGSQGGACEVDTGPMTRRTRPDAPALRSPQWECGRARRMWTCARVVLMSAEDEPIPHPQKNFRRHARAQRACQHRVRRHAVRAQESNLGSYRSYLR